MNALISLILFAMVEVFLLMFVCFGALFCIMWVMDPRLLDSLFKKKCDCPMCDDKENDNEGK